MQKLVVFLLSFTIFHRGSAQTFADSAVQELIRDGNINGLFMAVVKDSQVLYKKSSGLADFVGKRPVRPNTCFELGSISKVFTADLIYELHDKKQLDVNDPVTRYFPDAPASWSVITLSHLLNHTSGLQNYLLDPRFHAAAYFTGDHNAEADAFFRNVSTDSMIKMFYLLPLEYTPGTSWAYSNTGYMLLGKIAEKVTGKGFFDQVRQKLSTSFQMHQTMPNEMAAAQGCLAKGYAFSGSRMREAKVLTTTYAFSAGAWATTGNDMICYLKAIHNRTLLIDSTQRLWRELPTISEMPVTYHGGRFYTTYHGLKVIFHNGGTPGFSSSWIYVPEKNISIIVLINRQDYAPVDQLAWHVLAHYEPALKFPSMRLQTAEAKAYEEKARVFLHALDNDSSYTENFSAPLKTFMESENGKGLWRWIFASGFPTDATCVDEENIGRWKAYRFRLPSSIKPGYRLTFLLNEKKEITQILWY
jgi:CubicO group peptidase (beta-lactamase class C family)